MSREDLATSRKARLSPQKRALLEKLSGAARTSGTTRIPRRPADARPPLSFAQRRLWFLDQMVPGSPAYNVPMSFRVRGPLRREVLERAVEEVVRRHESLRTRLPSENGEPWQEIVDDVRVPVELVDVSDDPARLDALVFEADAAPSTWPRARSCASPSTGSPPICTWCCSTPTTWSSTAGRSACSGRNSSRCTRRSPWWPLPPPELAVQYADFAVWQREHLSGDRLENQLGYWRRQLGEGTENLELPLDRPRPPVQTFEGGDLRDVYPAALRDALQALCRREGVSLFVVLLGALNVLLHRCTGQSGIPVGSPVTNRTYVDIEPLIGMFVNTLVYRTDLAGDPDFREVLRRVHEVVNGAQQHQEVPFEVLVDALRPERYLSQNPLFQVCFNFLPARELKPGDELRIEAIEGVRIDTAKFDLWISVVDCADELLVEVEYNRDVFDPGTVRRLMDAFRVVWRPPQQDRRRPSPGSPCSPKPTAAGSSRSGTTPCGPSTARSAACTT
ncbi:Linear gramicidin synthase subunit D [Streptomyces alboniger]